MDCEYWLYSLTMVNSHSIYDSHSIVVHIIFSPFGCHTVSIHTHTQNPTWRNSLKLLELLDLSISLIVLWSKLSPPPPQSSPNVLLLFSHVTSPHKHFFSYSEVPPQVYNLLEAADSWLSDHKRSDWSHWKCNRPHWNQTRGMEPDGPDNPRNNYMDRCMCVLVLVCIPVCMCL